MQNLSFSKNVNEFIFQKNLFSCENFLDEFSGDFTVVISDRNIKKHYESVLQKVFSTKNAFFFYIPATEKSKSFFQVNKLLKELLQIGCNRNTTLVAFGGGVVLDLVGFLGSIFLRGVDVVYIPTTLIAMVDAALGGKTGINTSFGKNLVGSFSYPKRIYLDPNFLKTLPKKYLREGLSEMIKHALIRDEKLFQEFQANSLSLKNLDLGYIESHLITALNIKKRIVEEDPFERGIRALLNFGHTIAHGLELSLNYKISHGKAVSIGMVVESFISFQKQVLSKGSFESILNALTAFGLHFSIKEKLDDEKLLQALFYDKKNKKGEVHMVLLEDIGKCLDKDNQYSFPISLDELKEGVRFMKERFFC